MIDVRQLQEENRKIADQLHGDHTTELQKHKIDEQKKINEITEKMLLEASEKQARFENEKKDLISKYEKEIKQLLDKLEKLTSDHSSLSITKRDLENEYKEFQ